MGFTHSVVRATSETEAAWMLAEGDEGARPIAGGTDLMLQMERGRLSPTALVDIRRAGMDRLIARENALHIGATATASTLARWHRLQKHAYGLWQAASTLSVPQVRNFATVGGNLANASPAADMVPPILAMGGICEVRLGDHIRRAPAEEIALGPGRTSLAQGELLVNIILPRWREDAFHWFSKLGFRDAQVIAVVSLALSIEFEGDVVRRVGIALGSVAAKVTRAAAVEEFLVGQRLTKDSAREAMRLLADDISPITDHRSEGDYRLRVAQHYLGDALSRAYLHSQGLPCPKEPAPVPPGAADTRTDVLAELGAKAKKRVRIVPASALSFSGRKK